MTLDEVISYNRLFMDMETKSGDLEVAEYYRDTVKHLEELKELRGQILEYKRLLKAAVEDMYNSVNDVHCKYCSKWHTDQCQGTSHLDCYIENKFKWRYADEALNLIEG